MRAMESTRRKLKASEEKRFWRQVLLKWWCHYQKQVYQKHLIRSNITRNNFSLEYLKIIRSWKNWSFKGCSNDLITPSIAEDQKSKAMVISNKFEGIGCLFFEERWQSTILRSVQPLPPLLNLCLCYKTRIIATHNNCSMMSQ